jgi:hypothetical protein
MCGDVVAQGMASRLNELLEKLSSRSIKDNPNMAVGRSNEDVRRSVRDDILATIPNLRAFATSLSGRQCLRIRTTNDQIEFPTGSLPFFTVPKGSLQERCYLYAFFCDGLSRLQTISL